MNKKTQHRYLFIASLLLALGVMVNAAFAAHTWGPYHWARKTPQFTLKLGNNLSSAWVTYLTRTSFDWSNPPSGSTPLLTTIVAGARNNCAMVPGTTQVCNSNYGKNGWLGLASINIVGGVHITQGSAKLNDSYFLTSTYNNPNQRLHVMCQEIAHTFGLDHQSTDGSSQNSCMDYFSNTGANAGSTLSTKPNPHDFAQLNLIYSHLDTTTTVSATTATSSSSSNNNGANGRDKSEDSNQWGTLMRQSNNGRSSEYESFNRDGSITATHVFWTLEAAAKCKGCDHRYEDHQ